MTTDAAKLRDRLSSVGWGFTDATVREPYEGIHPYPAKFISEIPRTLLEILPVPRGTAVLDPFCGSGTTLVEAQRRGLRSVGIDLNPIACLISRVKTAKAPPYLAQDISRVLAAARKSRAECDLQIPNLDHWFKADVRDAIYHLTKAIGDEARPTSRDVLRLALSAILVKVSNQESDTRYAAVAKNVSASGVFKAFADSTAAVVKALSARSWRLPSAKVITADTLTLRAGDIPFKVGMVITSPPYPNAYEYWLYHKYRMWWLGFDPIAVKEREIGARAHFFKKNAHSALDFVTQMTETLLLCHKVLVPNGFVCVVVGRSRIHGKTIDNAEIVEHAARTFDLMPFFRTERPIARNRKSFNLSHANIATESVLVFRKTK